MDESAEQVPAANIARADLDRLCGRCERWSEAEGAMRLTYLEQVAPSRAPGAGARGFVRAWV